MLDEHITAARIAALRMVYEIEVTLMWLEQLPSAPAVGDDLANLRRVIEYRSTQVDAAIRSTQGSLAGTFGVALAQAGTRS